MVMRSFVINLCLLLGVIQDCTVFAFGNEVGCMFCSLRTPICAGYVACSM